MTGSQQYFPQRRFKGMIVYINTNNRIFISPSTSLVSPLDSAFYGVHFTELLDLHSRHCIWDGETMMDYLTTSCGIFSKGISLMTRKCIWMSYFWFEEKERKTVRHTSFYE